MGETQRAAATSLVMFQSHSKTMWSQLFAAQERHINGHASEIREGEKGPAPLGGPSEKNNMQWPLTS